MSKEIRLHTQAMVSRLNQLTYGHHYFKLMDDGRIHLFDDMDIPFEENEPEDLGPIDPLETLRNLEHADEEQRVYNVIQLTSFTESVDEIEKAIDMVLEQTKVPPRSLMKQLTDLLKPLGFKVVDRERTAGALKAWLESGAVVDLKELADDLRKTYPEVIYHSGSYKGYELGPKIIGPDFTIELEGMGIFIAIPSGPRAAEWQAGLDV